MAADALTKLGKYEIRGTLGKGAMGIVYDGFDPVIERRVAIKTIAKESMDPGEAAELLGRFKREAQAAGRLNHPGIVSIHDYGEDDGLAFIAMEFIQGKELKKYFESQQRFELMHIVRIMCDILDALDHAHRNGIVHRDIKPANIMITDEGRVKVADFGVAWIESSTMTQVGARIGTPAYMSPEQYQGLPVSGRSDLFSAGVILYQFLTGERPFTGGGYPLIQQILLQDPVPPSEINGDIPRAIDAVTLKALAKRPEDRFATARGFAEAFRKAATGESFEANIALVLNDADLPVNGRSATPHPASGRGTTTAGASGTGDGDSNLANVSLAAELEYWKEIKDSTEAADFETFLQVFPQSRFASLARRRMNRLETEPNGTREADALRQHEDTERARIEAEQAVIDAAEEEARRAGPRLRRFDAKEPRLVFPLAGEASDFASAMDMSPSMMVQPAFDTVGPAPFTAAVGPSHARRRTENTARTPTQPERPHRFAASAFGKLPRLPLVLALAAALVLAATWYGARPELAPIVAALTGETQAILARLEHQWHAHDGQQPEQPQKDGDDARLAHEQRMREQALKAERNQQLALAQQKEEAARAAASQDYERARALLNQGRSSEAVRLLRDLAHQGHGPAAKTLGDLYSRGEHVLLDMQEAARFYAIAERNGVKIDRPAFVSR